MYLKEVYATESQFPIRSTADAARVLMENFKDADREYFISVNLDAQGRPISYHIVSAGDVQAVHFTVSTVFKVALLQNATSVIICHNHPSGTPVPSTEDLTSTQLMIDAGKMIGIRVLDHFILTPSEYVSLKETYGYLFE